MKFSGYVGKYAIPNLSLRQFNRRGIRTRYYITSVRCYTRTIKTILNLTLTITRRRLNTNLIRETRFFLSKMRENLWGNYRNMSSERNCEAPNGHVRFKNPTPTIRTHRFPRDAVTLAKHYCWGLTFTISATARSYLLRFVWYLLLHFCVYFIYIVTLVNRFAFFYRIVRARWTRGVFTLPGIPFSHCRLSVFYYF